METKRVKSLFIKLNNNRTIEIQESKTRAFLLEQSNKFHNLLKKYKIGKE